MDILKYLITLLTLSFLSSGCSIGYLLKSSWHQTKILKSRVPIKEALKDDSISEDVKSKLRIAQEAKAFAEKELHLKKSDNYNSFVQLDRPYVSYIVRAAKEYELEPHLWWFPLVGKMPYKGYFNEEGAKEEANTFNELEYDTYVRGVSAYSTLGWFDDPLLSSMTSYKEHTLVDTVIHETVHATIFIKDNVDFNERLATFLGREGTKLFYLKREGPNSPTLKRVELLRKDDRLFSDFISKEIKELKNWYKENEGKIDQDTKWKKIKAIQARFKKSVLPKMKTKRYARIATVELNNARLLSYETYVADLSDFEKLHTKLGGDFKALVSYCKGLEKEEDPIAALKAFVAH